MESKIYTAQELRAAILDIKSFQGNRQTIIRIENMLRQAAEVQERCDKVIARCNKAKGINSPTDLFEIVNYILHEMVNYILRGDTRKEEK